MLYIVWCFFSQPFLVPEMIIKFGFERSLESIFGVNNRAVGGFLAPCGLVTSHISGLPVHSTVLGPFTASHLSLLESGHAALVGRQRLSFKSTCFSPLISHPSRRLTASPWPPLVYPSVGTRWTSVHLLHRLRSPLFTPPFFFLYSLAFSFATIICFLSILSLGSPEPSWWHRNRSVCMGSVFHQRRYIIWKSFPLMVPDLVWMLLCVSKMDIITQTDASRYYSSLQLFFSFMIQRCKSDSWMFF